ncbi:hypothetical protein NKH28_31415 [Mesorhizobium sp. M1227]|uniref:hypothetical protein n=1 Tax=Mesorhizobium sp. M1227 TaxID=2957071 RepID=UPI0033387076
MNNSELSRFEIVECDDISQFRLGQDAQEIRGNSQPDVERILAPIVGRPIYIDITGLSHHVWMPLLRNAIESGADVWCIYAEPEKYQFTNSPRPSEFFDLSERIRGIAPIPTFAKLSTNRNLKLFTVPLLGFEGTRFRYMVETLQPEGKNVFPFIGVPGFKPEYPFHTYQGNANTLDDTRAWENVRFMDAACPFSVAAELASLQALAPNIFLQVALIGTKPHALGAALYALRNQNVELVYDHPVRKPSRTSGSSRCHVYHVSEFLEPS